MQLSGTIITPTGVRKGRLDFGTYIRHVALEDGTTTGPWILPGFVDTHVHGGDGGDTMDGAAGVRKLAAFHARHGTTTLYPTTMTNPWQRVLAALRGVAEVAREARHEAGDEGGARLPDIPGAHLEGPFISPERLGAQPPHAVVPTPERVGEVLALDVVRLVTLAPDIDGALDAARQFARAGVRVSIGHTRASYEQVRSVIDAIYEANGVVGFTHLYNAMGGLGAREPGPVGAALTDAESYAELILDLHHVHPASFQVALAAKPDRLHLVTDAIRACGLAEGETELGGQAVTVKGGAARLADGTLAGSVLTLDRALKNILGLGIDIARASRLLSAVPAAYMGLTDRGTLEVGKRADIVVLDDNIDVIDVLVAGRSVFA
ncbi:MAG: N-acetylglucosamine-6-phosphate deacetylase [Trueperaceae bacterium]|nr:N-acetylglucosamine-6-phosphate deacetylase [Trueperaceae bacterium]